MTKAGRETAIARAMAESLGDMLMRWRAPAQAPAQVTSGELEESAADQGERDEEEFLATSVAQPLSAFVGREAKGRRTGTARARGRHCGERSQSTDVGSGRCSDAAATAACASHGAARHRMAWHRAPPRVARQEEPRLFSPRFIMQHDI